MSVPVSALIITFNEEKYIERCLRSLCWAYEIVVIDSHSTDRTQELCLAPGKPWSDKIQFHSRAWSGFKDQRNFSLKKAKHDWVLVVDADEECSPELAERIQGYFQSDSGRPPYQAFKVRRVEYFLGKAIHHGIWNPSYQDRFFHREGVQYTNDIHEYPIFPQPPQVIHEPLFHAPDFEPQRFLEKMNKYTTVEAKNRFDNGQRTNAFRMLFAFPAMFLKNYFYYGAYKDGFHGFAISILEGVSRAVRHLKIWQMSLPSQSEKK